MRQHTPGPWTIKTEDIGDEYIIVVPSMIIGPCNVRIVDSEGGLYSWEGAGIDVAERWANARLIAAAPDLLAACEKLLASVSGGLSEPECYRLSHEGAREARAAIAKARG